MHDIVPGLPAQQIMASAAVEKIRPSLTPNGVVARVSTDLIGLIAAFYLLAFGGSGHNLRAEHVEKDRREPCLQIRIVRRIARNFAVLDLIQPDKGGRPDQHQAHQSSKHQHDIFPMS